MAVTRGAVDVGISLFGWFIKSRFLAKLPFFSPRYAVSVDRNTYRVSKDCDVFVGEPLRALAGSEVEVIVSEGEIFALRGLEQSLQHIILTCYLLPLESVFIPEVLRSSRQIMTQTLVQEGVVGEEAAGEFDQWIAVKG